LLNLIPQRTNVAIMGVSGYSGAELARLLLHHPRLTAPPLFLTRADSTTTDHIGDLHPQLATASGPGDPIHPFSWDLLAEKDIEILFLATPHEQSREWVPEALARNLRVIDLSGAWRLQQPENRAVYNLTDSDRAAADRIQQEAIYGSPELHASAIAQARLVANPGCYATSIILALAPLLGIIDRDHGIIADSKSGVSGAGKGATAKTHFMYAADNLSAYSVFGHRHTGELLEQLHLTEDDIQFTPHLLPIPRGILSTIYVRLTNKHTSEDITEIFTNAYAGKKLVRLHRTPNVPQIQHVVRTNYCDLGFQLASDGRRLVLVSCLDNLLKGAAGQAVQNMNLMLGWDESEGLL
jgi:N-acetyl-gamma-glutamyl-phosphate reductase